MPAPIGFGTPKLISTQFGWVAGGPGGSELVVTRDGGRTWQNVQVPTPAGLGGGVYTHYSAPRFASPRQGFLPVTFNRSVLEVLRTSDAGRTWEPAVVLAEPPGQTFGDLPALALPDSALLVPRRGVGGGWVLHTYALTGAAGPSTAAWPRQPAPDPRLGPIWQASFFDPTRGWVLGAKLRATSDGGATWTDITPKPAPPPPAPTGKRPLLLPRGPMPFGPPARSPSAVNAGEGGPLRIANPDTFALRPEAEAAVEAASTPAFASDLTPT